MTEKPKPPTQVVNVAHPIPSIYCHNYRYDILNGIFTLEGGRGDAWHVGISLPLHLAIDLHQKLGVSIAEVIRQQQAAAQPAEPPAAPTIQ